jgi:hypothetical protein
MKLEEKETKMPNDTSSCSNYNEYNNKNKLVLSYSLIDGDSFLSMIRASLVVNCQLNVTSALLRAFSSGVT